MRIKTKWAVLLFFTDGESRENGTQLVQLSSTGEQPEDYYADEFALCCSSTAEANTAAKSDGRMKLICID